MDAIIKDLSLLFSTHWPFIAVTIVLYMFGQVTKVSIFTKKRAQAMHGTWKGGFLWWGRKTLPLHPVITGGLIGLVWTNPVSIVTTTIGSVFYFAFAGAMSVWSYQILKGIAKKKGFELGPLPGADSVVPPESNRNSNDTPTFPGRKRR